MFPGRAIGYLPDNRPHIGSLISLAFQHVLTMFPATVLVAVLTGFDVGVTLFASGLATVIALVGSRFLTGTYIPLYYGSSFSYIAVVAAVVVAYGEDGVRVAQVGIIGTAIVNVLAGLIISRFGKAKLDQVLPPIITGSVAIVIGIALSRAALDMAAGTCCLTDSMGNSLAAGNWWIAALATLVATIFFSVYLRGKGLIGMLPVLLGAAVGYLIAIPLGLVNFTPVIEAPLFGMPRFTLPAFGHAGAIPALLAIAPIAIATIPESTAHLYQISLYVDRLADELRVPRPQLNRHIGKNLLLDGVGDLVNGLLGGCAGTNYGENNSLMVISRNYSGPVLMVAGLLAMVFALVAKLAALVGTLPTAVTGGLAIYLFGVIGMQGIALIMSEQVDLFDSRQLAVGAVILVIGIGGNTFPGGAIPLGPFDVPAIATAAMVGIALNSVFVLVPVSSSNSSLESEYTELNPQGVRISSD